MKRKKNIKKRILCIISTMLLAFSVNAPITVSAFQLPDAIKDYVDDYVDLGTDALIVKVVVSKNIYFLFVQVIRYCSVPDVSINKLSTFIGNHVRHRILPDHHHFE